MSGITVDTVIEAYIRTRNEIKELEDQIAEKKIFQARKEEYLMAQMDSLGLDSVKSKHGTVYTSVFESVTVADAESFFEYVKQNDAFHLLEKRASKTEVLHIMGDRVDSGRPNPPPPGLNYTAIRKLGVRKA